MRKLVLIAHNLRSAHNVGAILRTCEGLGVSHVWLTGYSPYPLQAGDGRLPHIATKVDRQIAKTALGAEKLVHWKHSDSVLTVISELRRQGFSIAALEQGSDSISLPDFQSSAKLALIVGREVQGLEPEILAGCDHILEIPMFGQKESYNVAAAAAMALYHLRFVD